jgi:hypothetical protein
MWKLLYDALLQLLTIPWAQYLNDNKRQGRLVRDTFFNDIYGWSGLILFSVTMAFCLLYYFYFNRRFGRYYSLKSYFLSMVFSSFLIGGGTAIVAKTYVADFVAPTWSLVIWLALINFLFGLILFFLVSLICQVIAISVRRLLSIDLSPMGSRTPF